MVDWVQDIPKKWEILGDLVLLPPGSFNHENWRGVDGGSQQRLWELVATALKTKRVAMQVQR